MSHHSVVSKLSPSCPKAVSKLCQNCLQAFLELSQNVSKLSQCCLKVILCFQEGWQGPPRPRMHRPMTSSQTREYGRPAHQFGAPSRTAAPTYQTSRTAAPSYRDQTSQYRPPQAHFGAPVTYPPQLLSQEGPQRPWDEEGYNFEEGGGHRVPETSRDFFDSFPVTVHDQSDPELERAVNDFAHSFESIKQVIFDYGFNSRPIRLCGESWDFLPT